MAEVVVTGMVTIYLALAIYQKLGSQCGMGIIKLQLKIITSPSWNLLLVKDQVGMKISLEPGFMIVLI